ncbi:MAG: nucleotidyltransferase domain-containing protein [archaeon]
MKNKDATVIKCLIEKKHEEMNILKISKELRMDYKNIYSIIKRLEKESLIKLESFGHSCRINLVAQVHPVFFEAEYIRKKELLKNKNIAVMLNDFRNAISSKLYIMLIFGSYAKNTHGPNSDIDLMFIVPEEKTEKFEKEIAIVSKTLPLPIHSLVFSEREFLEMARAKSSNVGLEAIKNNVILYGIENYYELVKG